MTVSQPREEARQVAFQRRDPHGLNLRLANLNALFSVATLRAVNISLLRTVFTLLAKPSPIDAYENFFKIVECGLALFCRIFFRFDPNPDEQAKAKSQ